MPAQSSDDPTIDGVVNLFKPVGKSSAHYVYRLRPILGTRKVGHAGTLDPFAEGVLVACVGKATKLVERIMNLPKRYRTTIRLGVTNATFDTEQPFEPVGGAVPPSREELENVVKRMTGRIEQAPPVFSAMRVGGRFSYQLAKNGKATELKARSVQIYQMTIEAYEWPLLELSITCGRGTYIRAIARDIGKALDCGGVCERLIREAVGPFEVSHAVNLLEADATQVQAALLPIEDARCLLQASAINQPAKDEHPGDD